MRRPKEKALTGRALNQLQDINEATLKPCLKITYTNSNRPAVAAQAGMANLQMGAL